MEYLAPELSEHEIREPPYRAPLISLSLCKVGKKNIFFYYIQHIVFTSIVYLFSIKASKPTNEQKIKIVLVKYNLKSSQVINNIHKWVYCP